MDGAAKRWIQEYKKLFDQVARYNAGENVAEDITTETRKAEIQKIGKLVDELGGGAATQVPKKVIKKIGKIVPENEKTATGTKKVQDSGERFALNKPKTVVSIESNPELDARILSSTKNKYDVIREYLIEVYGGRTFELSDGRRAIMDKSDAKELSHKADKKRTAQLGNLDEIISKAKYDHSAYNVEHNKFIDFHYYEITVKYGGEEFDLWINVGTGKYDGKNHIYSITNKKEDASTNYGVGGPVGNHLQNASSKNSISQNAENSNTFNEKSAKNHKQSQFDIIQETNPMGDDYHVGIRSVEDIRTWDEVLKLDDESEGQFFWGDFSRADAEQALKDGKITVYSSYPIRNGVFVSTSYVQAEEYAGGRGKKVYSKTVPLTDVAWINGDEGQFAAADTSTKTVDSGERFALSYKNDEAKIEKQKIRLKAEYETDTVFSEAGVKKRLAAIDGYKNLPAKDRSDIESRIWTELNESNGYDSRKWIALKWVSELTDRIANQQSEGVSRSEREIIFNQVNDTIEAMAQSGRKSVRASMEGELRAEIETKTKAQENAKINIRSEIYQSLKKITDIKTARFAAASDYKGRNFKGTLDNLTKMDWRGKLNDNIVRREMGNLGH